MQASTLRAPSPMSNASSTSCSSSIGPGLMVKDTAHQSPSIQVKSRPHADQAALEANINLKIWKSTEENNCKKLEKQKTITLEPFSAAIAVHLAPSLAETLNGVSISRFRHNRRNPFHPWSSDTAYIMGPQRQNWQGAVSSHWNGKVRLPTLVSSVACCLGLQTKSQHL